MGVSILVAGRFLDEAPRLVLRSGRNCYFPCCNIEWDLTFQQVSLRVCGPLPNETTLFAILASFFTHLY